MVRLLLSLILLVTAVASAEIYQYTDENGNVVYTDSLPDDQKNSGKAKPVELPPLPTIPSFNAPADAVSTKQKTVSRPAYTKFVIVKPADHSAVRANNGNIAVVTALEPRLKISAGQQVVLFMDGKEVASGSQTRFNLFHVDRGTHTVHAEIQNRKRKDLISTRVISFTVKRHSVLNPNTGRAAR